MVMADDSNCHPNIPIPYDIVKVEYCQGLIPNCHPGIPMILFGSNIVPNSHQNIPIIMLRSDIAKVCHKFPPKHPNKNV